MTSVDPRTRFDAGEAVELSISEFDMSLRVEAFGPSLDPNLKNTKRNVNKVKSKFQEQPRNGGRA